MYVAIAMASSPRRARVVLLLMGSVLALAAWPGAASAQLTVTEANLNGVSSVPASPPGSVFRARVTAIGGNAWQGTRHRFGNHGDCEPNGGGADNAVSFNVTAPEEPGTYNAGFTATGAADCGGEQSNEEVLTDALKVTTPAPNPALPQQCGINVMLVLDESGSIQSSGATEKVRRATRAFLNSLSGTGCRVSIVDFSTTAAWPVGYHVVTGSVDSDGQNASGTIGQYFEPYLKNDYNPAGWTNWEDAFKQVAFANADDPDLPAPDDPVADLVVFMTDGDPTARNLDPPATGTKTGVVEGEAEALRRAAAEADVVKSQGSRVFALGVGEAVTKATSARRLTAISGFDKYPAKPFRNADYTLVQDFDNLGQALREIVAELCGAGVTVTKYVDKGDGEYVADRGWGFTVRVSVPGGFSWIRPSDATGDSATANTDDNGIAKFLWRPTELTDASTVEVVDERTVPGYTQVKATCQVKAVRRSRRRTIQTTSDPILSDIVVQPGSFVTCAVYNKIDPGTITIQKDATPQGSQAFDFTGSLGRSSRSWMTARTSRCRAPSPTSRPGPTRSASSFRRLGAHGRHLHPRRRRHAHWTWDRGRYHARDPRCRHLHLQRPEDRSAGADTGADTGAADAGAQPTGPASAAHSAGATSHTSADHPASSRKEGASGCAGRPADPVQADRDERRFSDCEEGADGRPPARGRRAERTQSQQARACGPRTGHLAPREACPGSEAHHPRKCADQGRDPGLEAQPGIGNRRQRPAGERLRRHADPRPAPGPARHRLSVKATHGRPRRP